MVRELAKHEQGNQGDRASLISGARPRPEDASLSPSPPRERPGMPATAPVNHGREPKADAKNDVFNLLR